MNILAIETSGLVASVCILTEQKIIAEFTLNDKLTHGETLVPLIENIFKSTCISLDQIDYIAVANGPGSFTGLRIGMATAKGLAHGLDIKIIEVPTLYALAYNVYEQNSIIIPIVDAKRNELYTAYFEYQNNSLIKISDYSAKHIEEIFNDLKIYNKPAIFLGDGTSIYKDTIKDNNFSIMPLNNCIQKASSVGLYAINHLHEAVCSFCAKPFYIRKSQADEMLEGNKNAN